MIVGIGVDIIEIERIATLIKRQRNAISRFLTLQEQELLEGKADARRGEFVAGRFAAKEAAAKALGTGIGGGVSFQDLEIFPTERGKPQMNIRPEVLSTLGLDPSRIRVHLSISHSQTHAIAQVVVEQL